MVSNTMSEEKTYHIIRFFFDRPDECEIVLKGLTKEQAQEHCNDPETSSSTATTKWAKIYTEVNGPWFDGWNED